MADVLKETLCWSVAILENKTRRIFMKIFDV